MAGSQQEEKTFFSSFTSLFKPKPAEAQPKKPANEKKATTTLAPSNAPPASATHANAAQANAQTPAEHDHADHSDRSERSERSLSELSEYSDAEHAMHADHAEHSDTETSAVEQAGELGAEDQQKSEELDKAIDAAEARTAAKLETIKNEKKETKEGEEGPERKTWLVQTGENIKYTFISKETEEAFAEFSILFDKMFDDFPYNKVDLMFGLMMLDDYYKNAPVLSSERVEDMEFIETARFYMKFAYCCYGWKFIYGILNRKPNRFITSMVGFDANIKAIFDCTGVEPKDIIVSKFTSSVFDPGHYICMCHERKTIVVAFRGTFHVRDALTDLVASNTAFMQGTAHTGLLRTANNKFKLLAPLILKLYQENPTYKVIVVGHSLGAGTASLFSLIFHEAHPEVPMHCYAYAPPGVVSPDVALASTTQALIDSIVVGTDIVPRLSFATLVHLKKIIMQILSSGNNTFQRAFQWMSGGLNDGLKDRVNGMFKIPETVKIEPTPVPISDVSVFPPGRLILLVPHTLSEVEADGEECSSDSETEEKAKGKEKGEKKEKEKEGVGMKAVEEKEEIDKEKEEETGEAVASEKQGKAVVEGKSDVEGKIIRKAILEDKVILEIEKEKPEEKKEKPEETEKPEDKKEKQEEKKEKQEEKKRKTPPSSPTPYPSTPVSSTSTSSSSSHPSSTSTPPPSTSSSHPSSPPPSTLPTPSIAITPSPSSPIPSVSSPSPSPSSTPVPSSTPPAAVSSNPLRRLSASVAPLFWTTPKTPQEKAKKAKKPPKPKNVYLMEYSNCALFNEIIISPTMFTSHMPSAYDRALDSCLETMRQIRSGSKHNIVVTME